MLYVPLSRFFGALKLGAADEPVSLPAGDAEFFRISEALSGLVDFVGLRRGFGGRFPVDTELRSLATDLTVAFDGRGVLRRMSGSPTSKPPSN